MADFPAVAVVGAAAQEVVEARRAPAAVVELASKRRKGLERWLQLRAHKHFRRKPEEVAAAGAVLAAEGAGRAFLPASTT